MPFPAVPERRSQFQRKTPGTLGDSRDLASARERYASPECSRHQHLSHGAPPAPLARRTPRASRDRASRPPPRPRQGRTPRRTPARPRGSAHRRPRTQSRDAGTSRPKAACLPGCSVHRRWRGCFAHTQASAPRQQRALPPRRQLSRRRDRQLRHPRQPRLPGKED